MARVPWRRVFEALESFFSEYLKLGFEADDITFASSGPASI
jgi:hypothetical protein